MKRILLSALVLLATNVTFSQVILKVVSPTDISGSIDHAYVDSTDSQQSSSPWTNIPDMTKVYNAVLDTVVLAYDDGNTPADAPAVGLAGDSACCGTIINDVADNIAFIYRGSCEFGAKAYNAQLAGAKAVIIVNPAGAPQGMAAGSQGANVTIPVTMISAADGQMIKDAIQNGQDVVMYFGPQYGYYGDDLGVPKETSLVARAAAIPALTATNDTEFDVPLGCWVYNYGSNDYLGATVTANIDYNASSIYSNTSTSFDVLAGDSSFVTFPVFIQSSYPNGDYMISYAINHASADQTPENDSISFQFSINDEYYGLSPLDVNTGNPINQSAVSIPADQTAGFISSTTCVAYADSNASRLAVRGLSFSAATYDPLAETTLEGEYLEFVAYSWDDQFVDVDDANFALDNLNAIATADYTYDFDLQNEVIGIDFDNAIVLTDNQRYLFCMTSYTENVYFGYDNSISFNYNYDTYRQPLTMINNGTSWYSGLAGSEPTLTLRVLDATAASVEENLVDVTPYPNPASDIITIPLTGLEGEAQLMITDMTGRIMTTRAIYLSGNDKLRVNVSDLPSGFYTFNINFDNGQVSKFNVAITK